MHDKLPETAVAIERMNVDGRTDAALLDALTHLAAEHQLKYLLSHHDDGVVWGVFAKGQWAFSADSFDVSPHFRVITLQECRVFGEKAELHLWRTENTLKAALLKEGNGVSMPYYDRQQLLWGDLVETYKNGFTLLAEGSQGLRHAVPMTQAQPRVRLHVRHYIAYQDNRAYVQYSRLYDLKDNSSPA